MSQNPSTSPLPTTETASSLVRSIHSDERQLRTLVVTLSLAGGLVLALLLGFGIYFYWHCCRRPTHTVFYGVQDYKRQPKRFDSSTIDQESSASLRKSMDYKTPCNHVPSVRAPTPPPIQPYPDIEPSAPAAKDMEFQEEQSSSSSHCHASRNNDTLHYYLAIPPPAYTPSA